MLAFDFSLGSVKPRPPVTTYAILFNGLELEHESFPTWIDAAERIVELCRQTGSAVGCFKVEEVSS